MQFDRSADGVLTPLPKPSVDTGMGLERLAAVMQGVHSNYEIDLFQNLIQAAAAATGATDLHSSSLRVIADHIRATAFLIADGVLPSNEGRGYVLRRIMRRAIRHGYKLGAEGSFFRHLVRRWWRKWAMPTRNWPPPLFKPPASSSRKKERFAETLSHGMKLLEEDIAALSGKVIPGETVFKLYDTYGFPVDLTADIARERGLQLDHAGFEQEMAAQRDRARAHSQFGSRQTADLGIAGCTEFHGYDRLEEEATIIGLFRAGQAVETLNPGDEGVVVLDHTLFYAESGGQVGDSGWLRGDGLEFAVRDTQKQGEGVFTHLGVLNQGQLQCGQTVLAQVNGASPPSHRAASFRHASTSCRVAPNSRNPCWAERLAGRSAAAALRLLAFRADQPRATGRH